MNNAFKSLQQELILLHYRWKIFRNVYAIDEDHIRLLNEVDGSFFGTVQDIYWKSIILDITRLTDKRNTGRNKNLTLLQVLEEYRTELEEATIHDIIEVSDLIDEKKDLLFKYRNKALAHFDYDYGIDMNAITLPDISRQDIEDILDLMRRFLDLIEGAIEDCTTAYNHITVYGGKMLYNSLKDFKPQ